MKSCGSVSDICYFCLCLPMLSCLLTCLVAFEHVLGIIFEKSFRSNQTKGEVIFIHRQCSFASVQHLGALETQDYLKLVLGLEIFSIIQMAQSRIAILGKTSLYPAPLLSYCADLVGGWGGSSLEQRKCSHPSRDFCPLSTKRPSKVQFTLPSTSSRLVNAPGHKQPRDLGWPVWMSMLFQVLVWLPLIIFLCL